jgi:hypothetical protein
MPSFNHQQQQTAMSVQEEITVSVSEIIRQFVVVEEGGGCDKI